MRMAEYHRAPRSHVINITIAIRICDVSTRGLANEERCPPHRTKRADGAINAAGNQVLGPPVEFIRFRSIELGHGFYCWDLILSPGILRPGAQYNNRSINE